MFRTPKVTESPHRSQGVLMSDIRTDLAKGADVLAGSRILAERDPQGSR